jgi:hypothetical protein
MVWKGIEGDSTIYWSVFDGHHFSPQQPIIGRGTSQSPALVVLDHRLYAFWKGAGNDNNVWSAWIDDKPDAIWQAQEQIFYRESKLEGMVSLAIGSSHHPATTTRHNGLALVWKGIPGDSALRYATLLSASDKWSGQIPTGFASSTGPSVARLYDQLFMAWKGMGDDSTLYWSSLGS